MGSFNGNGHDRNVRRQRQASKRRALLNMESLENRALLSIGDGPIPQPTNADIADVKHGPMARAGGQLLKIYQEFQAHPNDWDKRGPEVARATFVDIQADRVGVDVSAVGDFDAARTALRNLGMQITAVDATRRIVEGYLPIAQLITAVRLPQVSGITPVFSPFTRQQGTADNQADRVFLADTARTQFNVNGSGVKVGVVSDSANQFDNPNVAGVGLAESVSSGDLPNNVQVIADGAAGDSDEGRAMLEQIFDIAPGASLAFHTANGGEVNFANGIRALAQAGSRVIVDDIGYITEPFFQDGIVAQAVTDVTNNLGVTFFSAAGNSSDSGFQSRFRGVNANITNIGAGRYMDFDPGAGIATALPITVRAAGGPLVLQWDNPFYLTGGVTSDLDLYLLDANGAVVASAITNNIVQGMPLELVGIPATATQIVVQVAAGSPDPGRIVVLDPFADSVDVSNQFGTDGGNITYPTIYGHPASNEAIGVGAVPWWAAAPFSTGATVPSEIFSSFGPGTFVFNADGSRKATVETRLQPVVSAPDGNNTTFFSPNFDIDTTAPPARTGPATSTNLDPDTLPNFFGTSSAAPNLAAVAALMKQLAPNARLADIRAAMIASTIPLNGAAKGQWEPQGGFGLVQATSALSAIDTLRVATVTPAVGQSLNTSPNAVVVTFTRPVNFGTVQASDLTFLATPPGVTVTVGQPTLLNATTVSFPLQFNTAPGATANGGYSYTFAQNAITSADGRALSAFSGNFALSDNIAPKITNTTILGRTILIQFSEAMRPATINGATVQLLRQIPGGFELLNGKPGFVITYDAANNRAIIDVSQVSQDNLPSGTYAISVLDAVTDQVGNRLDGEFLGRPQGQVFPSGDNKPQPAEQTDNDTFVQILSNLVLRAPQVLNVGLDQTAGASITNPRITGVLYNRQSVEVFFSQQMDPASITPATVYLRRSVNGTNFQGAAVVNAPVTYDQVNRKAVINLAGLAPADLPDTLYALSVIDLVRDASGNRLDGESRFPLTMNPDNRITIFPSGDQKAGGLEQTDNDVFTLLIPDLLTSGPARFARYDSGIAGDQNTNVTRPRITGTVTSSFPGAVGGLTVVAQFNGLHNGTFDLNVGAGGRGFVGTPDVVTTTDANGNFVIQAPQDLPDGFHTVRIVVVGQSEAPPLPGLSTRIDQSFRIDTTRPAISTSVAPLSRLSSLTSLTLDVVDPILPLSNPLAVPTQLSLPALDPSTASNISNYTLVNLGSDNAPGGTGTAADTNLSSFITAASFVSTNNRQTVDDPYTGQVTLTFAPGLPSGRYQIVARRPQPGFAGITDAAGNPIDGDPSQPGAQDFSILLDLQPQATFITSLKAISPADSDTPVDPNRPETFVASDPRSFFELVVPGTTPRATAPPTAFFIDFSNPLDPTRDYTNAVQLFRSANSPTSAPDGDFGVDSSFTSGAGHTRVTGLTVTLINSIPGAIFGQPGFQNRLLVQLPAGTTLPADSYRLFMPNSGGNAVVDLFGNLLDGEFLGNSDGKGGFEALLPNGQFRSGLTGDQIPGGAFETGYVVVPNGNVIYARPDYVDVDFLTSDDPDGSLAKPYPTLAPEATATAANGGDLNSVVNFGTGFDPRFDRNQNGHFDRSALFAAQVASTRGPVVVVALPGAIQRDPVTGRVTQSTFVLAAPAGGTDPTTNNASASVPFNTTLVFDTGSTLKLQNASLWVQNQGSALQVRGGINDEDRVNFTSFSDDSIGGDTNGDGAPGAGGNRPGGGDWGAIGFRNFNQDGRTNRVPFPVDGRLKGPNGTDARSGADDAMSVVDFARIRFGGGPVPRTIGASDGPITLFNSRPAITNTLISDSRSAAVSGTVGAITADFNSFREDELARGPLIRRVEVINNSINGIFIRAELSGEARQTNAIDYPDNPQSEGGVRNFVVDDPLPHVLTTRLVIGEEESVLTGGQTSPVTNRLYIQPGMMFKLPTGGAIDAVTVGSSINIGDRTYISQFDANRNFGPTDAGFRNNTAGDAEVVFTSFYDDDATTFFRDPNTGVLTTIVAASDTDSGGRIFIPTPGSVPASARWGGLGFNSGAVAVIDEVEFRYGGGSVNIPSGTIAQRDVLAFEVPNIPFIIGYDGFNKTTVGALGTRAKVTNNDFFDNLEAPIGINPNGLLVGDPLRPLVSGNPFFRGNVMERNVLNGMEILPDFPNRGGTTWIFYPDNVNVDTLWDDTDLTYILRSTLRLTGAPPLPPSLGSFTSELKPFVSLTVQSSLPDTLLADGSRVARPGESAIVKLLNDPLNLPVGDANGFTNNVVSDSAGGAGFLVGIDDGVDPDADPLVDPGAFSQLRFLGIAGNETTGQQRVPVVLTSLRDETVGRTVRGVDMFETLSGNTTAPAAGDAGVIGFGGLSLSDYNLYDPRNGNIIDNADISYMTRIEVQGGGIAYSDSANPAADKLGLTPETQFNTQKAMTISNSNLSNFSQIGVIARSSLLPVIQVISASGLFGPGRTPDGATAARGQGIVLNMSNNVMSNMPIGVRLIADNVNNDQFPSPNVALFLHNTFSAIPLGIDSVAVNYNNLNSLSHNYFVVMNNIFEGATTAAVQYAGMSWNSQGQFNLYSNSVPVVSLGAGLGHDFFNNNAITGSAAFRDPATGDYTLLPNSDAIDRSLSELGEVAMGRYLKPISNQALNGTGGTRNTTGRNSNNGGLTFGIPGDIITLPGFPDRTFEDQWVPAIPGSPGAVPGPSTVPGANWYVPITGERDQLGFLRVDDPTNPRIGAGSRPFFDIGPLERRIIIPPKVVDVTAILADPGSPTGVRSQDFYAEGGVAGSSTAPLEIRVRFDNRLDPATLNNRTVVLQASGGDSIFGNGNNANDRTIDLSGKLRYEPTTQTLIIDLTGIGQSLGSDLFRVTLFGNGSDVIRDPQGNPLDAENTAGGTPTGAQRPLPSGDGVPGGNFFLSFSIDATAPSVVAGSLRLDPSSDTGRAGDNITNNNTPSFSGTITDAFGPGNFLVGQVVVLDLAGPDGIFGTGDDIQRAGTALTTAGGAFVVTVGTNGANLAGGVAPNAIAPESAVNVGPDGFLGPNPTTGINDDILSTYGLARVRVFDQSGNQSNASNPNAQTRFVVDTQGPRITASTPLPNSQSPVSGQIPVTLIVNENVNPSTLNASSILVSRSGGDGVFGQPNDVALSVSAGSIQVNPLRNAQGSMEVRFTVVGATVNDIYRVTLVGQGGNTVRDWAGNDIDGEFGSNFPSGNGAPGGDFNLDFIVFDTAIEGQTLFVDDDATGTPTGSRSAPYATITEALAAAGIGDTVAVLPGTYGESITLKSLVRVVSASLSSSDTNVIPGQALQTVLRPPAPSGGGSRVGVTAENLVSLPDFSTELAGFTIAVPLSGNPASGPIASGSYGVLIRNSDVLIDRNYIINADFGIVVGLSGVGAATPRIQNNGLIGNNNGMLVNAGNAITFRDGRPTQIANNTFAFNRIGLLTANGPAFTNSVLAEVSNNIFAQNFTGTTSRAGTAILAASDTILNLRGNLFSNNGPNASSGADDVGGRIGSGFDPSQLDSIPDANGNFTGNPGFANPRDPRPSPQGQGPAVYFLDANFDLTLASDAVDNAVNGFAPPVDFRSRSRVDVSGKGRAGFGPADIGAFEFRGSGGIAGIGGSGTVFSTTLNSGSTGSGVTRSAATALASTATPSLTVRFAQAVDRGSVQPADLVLSGDLDSVNPAHATSLSWVDDQTVQFNLAGSLGNGGTVNVEIPEGSILDANHKPLQGYSTTIPVATTARPVMVPTQPVTTTPTAITPAPAANPVAKVSPALARRQAAWARFLARRRAR
jgi:hypothetical protein